MSDITSVCEVQNYGASFLLPRQFGVSPVTPGGMDQQSGGGVCYASASDGLYKATSRSADFTFFVSSGGSYFNTVVIPYFRRGSTTVRNTNVSDPDVVVGSWDYVTATYTLFWIDGPTATRTNITPPSGGLRVGTPNSVTTGYGTHIAVIFHTAGGEDLYVSTDSGNTWTQVETFYDARFIRGRRGDRSTKNTALGRGQLYLLAQTSSAGGYSSHWGALGIASRPLPAGDIFSLDVFG